MVIAVFRVGLVKSGLLESVVIQEYPGNLAGADGLGRLVLPE